MSKFAFCRLLFMLSTFACAASALTVYASRPPSPPFSSPRRGRRPPPSPTPAPRPKPPTVGRDPPEEAPPDPTTPTEPPPKPQAESSSQDDDFVETETAETARDVPPPASDSEPNPTPETAQTSPSNVWKDICLAIEDVQENDFHTDLSGCPIDMVSTFPTDFSRYLEEDKSPFSVVIGGDRFSCFADGKVKSISLQRVLNAYGFAYENDVYLSAADLLGSYPKFCHTTRVRELSIPADIRTRYAFSQCRFKRRSASARADRIAALESLYFEIVGFPATVEELTISTFAGANGLFLSFMGCGVVVFLSRILGIQTENVVFRALSVLLTFTLSCYVGSTCSILSAGVNFIACTMLLFNSSRIVNSNLCSNAAMLIFMSYGACVATQVLTKAYSAATYCFICCFILLFSRFVANNIAFDAMRNRENDAQAIGMLMVYSYYLLNDFLEYAYFSIAYTNSQRVFIEIARNFAAIGPLFGNSIGACARFTFMIMNALPDDTPLEVYSIGGFSVIMLFLFILKIYACYILRRGQCPLVVNTVLIDSMRDSTPAQLYVHCGIITIPFMSKLEFGNRMIMWLSALMFCSRFIDITIVCMFTILAIVGSQRSVSERLFLNPKIRDDKDAKFAAPRLKAQRGIAPATIPEVPLKSLDGFGEREGLNEAIQFPYLDGLKVLSDNALTGVYSEQHALYSTTVGKTTRSNMARMRQRITVGKHIGYITVMGPNVAYSVLHNFSELGKPFSLSNFKFKMGKKEYKATHVSMYNFVRIGHIEDAIVLMTLDEDLELKGNVLRAGAAPSRGITTCNTGNGLSISNFAFADTCIVTAHKIEGGDSGSPLFANVDADHHLIALFSCTWEPKDGNSMEISLSITVEPVEGPSGEACVITGDTNKMTFSEHLRRRTHKDELMDYKQSAFFTAAPTLKVDLFKDLEEEKKEDEKSNDAGILSATSGKRNGLVNNDPPAPRPKAVKPPISTVDMTACSDEIPSIEPARPTYDDSESSDSMSDDTFNTFSLVERLSRHAPEVTIGKFNELLETIRVGSSRSEILLAGVMFGCKSTFPVEYDAQDVDRCSPQHRWFFGYFLRNPPRSATHAATISKLFVQMKGQWPTLCNRCWKSFRYNDGSKCLCGSDDCISAMVKLVKRRDHGKAGFQPSQKGTKEKS